uniref:Uncharacterized protein n=1 Tax=Arion vulgaris TaxID=1028688 RepID=A0A0B7BC09_9EUPU
MSHMNHQQQVYPLDIYSRRLNTNRSARNAMLPVQNPTMRNGLGNMQKKNLVELCRVLSGECLHMNDP